MATTKFKSDIEIDGNIDGIANNGQTFFIRRLSGIYFTWDADSYGTNFNHGIFSTDGSTYTDGITINSYGDVRINIDSNNNGTDAFIVGSHTTGTGGELFRIDDDGDSGLGVSSPTAKFDVNGAIYARGGTVVSGVDTKTNVAVAIAEGYYIAMNDGSYLRNLLGYNTSSNIEIGQTGTSLINAIELKAGSSGDVKVFSNTTQYVHFDGGTQRVGIGTTNPSTKLQVGAGSVDDRIRVYYSDGTYSEQTGWGMEFARTASYLRPNNDNVRTLNVGDASHTWATVNIDATALTWNTNTLATQSWVNSQGFLTSVGTINFNSLGAKTSGTGDYKTTGKFRSSDNIVSGEGSGGVALTINDGYGNANITFNHEDGTPEQSGNAARIEVNTDSSSGAAMWFELGSGVTGGVAGNINNAMTLYETRIELPQRISHMGDLDTYIDFTANRVQIVAGGTSKFDTNNTYLTSVGWTDLTGNQADIQISGFTNDAGYVTQNTTYSAGAGLDLTGTTFSVETDLSGEVYTIGRDGNDKYTVNTANHAWYLDGVLDMRLLNTGQLDVDGDVVAYSTVTSSDRKLKTDIETLDNASEKVSALRGVSFTWSHGKKAGKRDIGLIAQEVEEVIPDVVGESELLDGTMAKHVDYPKIVALLIEAHKEQQDVISQLEERIIDLENRI